MILVIKINVLVSAARHTSRRCILQIRYISYIVAPYLVWTTDPAGDPAGDVTCWFTTKWDTPGVKTVTVTLPYGCSDSTTVTVCDTDETCCGGSCCSNTCCNGVCCPAGQVCCGGVCCEPENCCNGFCCSDGTCCADSDCGHPSCWICIKCQCVFLCETDDCEDCISGSCTDRCPLLGQCKICDGNGNCIYTCFPELCEECVNNECKVCGGDTSLKCCPDRTCVKPCKLSSGACDTSHSKECVGCMHGTSTCEASKKRVYTGNDAYICVEPGCEGDCVDDNEVTCYTEYGCEIALQIPFSDCFYNFITKEYYCASCNPLDETCTFERFCLMCQVDPDVEPREVTVLSKKCN